MTERESKDILNIISKISPRYRKDEEPAPIWEHHLVYDSISTTLEPLYFWILDFIESNGFKVEKLIDNFVATPGSGSFGEFGQRVTIMQKQAMEILGSVNTVIKSIINIIYDLKEFEIRLKHYDAAKSSKKEEKEAGILALKQIWIDKVDINRGRGSINSMTYELGFTTLRDAFMAAKSVEDVDKMDLNDRVKRILKPRLAEFFEWIKQSEKELRKRFEIEKNYLKSQVNALKLYTRWAKPYLKAAEQLKMKETKSAHLVNIFSTLILELALFCKKKINIKDAAYSKEIPFKLINFKSKRDYYACIFVDLSFRAIPQRISHRGDYSFGGKVEINLSAFALNDDELSLLEEELEKSDIADALKLVEATTTESLAQLQEDIEKFLREDKNNEEENKTQDKTAENPFTALFSFILKEKPKKEDKNKKEDKIKEIKKHGIEKDSYQESIIRKYAELQAAEACYRIYDVFKKSHGMATLGGYEVADYFFSKSEKKF